MVTDAEVRPRGWQNISFGLNVVMKVEPGRVLDVGVGSGRWGMLVREVLEDASGDGSAAPALTVEGIALPLAEVSPHGRPFYDAIHVGEPAALLAALPAPWDLVLIGELLTSYERDEAHALLHLALERAAYVLVDVPLGPAPGTPAARASGRHSLWEAEDFKTLSPVREVTFHDVDGRFGSFVLSRRDARDLRGSLFLPADYAHLAVVGTDSGELEGVLARVGETALELGYLRHSALHRAADGVRRSELYNAARWLATRNRSVVTVRARGTHDARAAGSQVWLLAASPSTGEAAVPWDFVERDASWLAQEAEHGPFGKSFVSSRGRLRIPVGDDPELRFRTHPWSGQVEIAFRGRRETLDLYAPAPGELRVYPARTPMVPPPPPVERTNGAGTPRARGERFSPEDAERIEAIRQAAPRVLAIHCPRWLGVTSSTRALFPHTYPVPATADVDPRSVPQETIRHHAAVIAATGVPQLLVSGGDHLHLRLISILKDMKPDLRVDVLWHGGYVAFAEELEWELVQAWIEAARSGRVHSIGTVKKGMERFLSALGVRSRFVMNHVPGDPLPPPALVGDAPHVGLWASSDRKTPHAMLSALALAGPCHLHASALGPTARALVRFLGVQVAALHDRLLGHDELMAEIRKTHLSLYVTFAECCPMLPLESMKMGVPCLIGPASHLFEDDRYLFERLVVPFPDRADVIADFMRRALAERAEIMAAYVRYIPGYNEAAHRSVEELLA